MTGGAGAKFATSDLRRSERHSVDYRVIGEHRQRGDVLLHVANISAEGFLAVSATGLGKGERVTVRLPAVGRIEAFVAWSKGERAGFRFERVLRAEELARIVQALPPPARQGLAR